ncbi:hypothetical protein Rhe02_57150 [Rhizocola hellebori]|uniref:Uncharacterized protein n=1 Tax=Rhizocola hellebori TaxID=1392758 RepID=A0A8J3VJ50_9ACTN|nr:hypothetical protein Rhe02_57150 [Rhizocola hellebori]
MIRSGAAMAADGAMTVKANVAARAATTAVAMRVGHLVVREDRDMGAPPWDGFKSFDGSAPTMRSAARRCQACMK